MPRKFVFEVTIREGNDHFWDSLHGKPGIEEVHKNLVAILEDNGYFVSTPESLENTDVVLKRFEWEEDAGIHVEPSPAEPAE
jgi:hypothetical protein